MAMELELSTRPFVSLLCDDAYFPGISVLCKSLRTYSSHPIYILVSPGVSEATCRRVEELCTGIIKVDAISCPFKTADAAWVNSEMTKLNIWKLVQFEKIVYIDADAMLLESVDELFDIPHDFAAAPDVFPPDKFNAGVLVITPNLTVFEDLVSKLDSLTSHDGGDTGYLNSYFNTWYTGPATSRLSFGYNAQRILYWFTHDKRPGYWDCIAPLKIVHFSSSPKPWELKDKKGDLEWMWWQYFMGMR